MDPVAMKDLRPCDVCGSPVAGKTRDGNAIDFRRVVVERHFLDMGAIRERVGLGMMLGSDQLADVMGARPNATKPLSAVEILICNPCWYALDGLAGTIEAQKGRVLEECV